MLIPPKYILSPKISQLLQSIEACREIINSVAIPPEVEINIRRQSSLKSSLFSARIEGNTLTLEEIHKIPSKDQRRAEVFNILKAINWIHQRKFKDLSLKDLLEMHKMVLSGIMGKQDSGKFRTNLEAIFNSAGIAVYLPPRPNKILPLIKRLLKFISSPKEQFTPVKACLAHYAFEKIHPFLDGNGRVGRLLLQAVLVKGGYGMKGLVPLEEFLDSRRSQYYQALNEPEKDATDYLEFMLEAIADTALKAKNLVLEKQKADIEVCLLPRRSEILNIIRDHQMATFETIRRRFMAINGRTLRYDLKKLQEGGLILKRGTTKGVWYEAAKLRGT